MNATLRYHLWNIRLAKTKKKGNTKVGKDRAGNKYTCWWLCKLERAPQRAMWHSVTSLRPKIWASDILSVQVQYDITFAIEEFETSYVSNEEIGQILAYLQCNPKIMEINIYFYREMRYCKRISGQYRDKLENSITQ